MNKAATAAALCFLTSMMGAQTDSYAQGRAAYDAKRYAEAVTLLAQAEREQPGKTDALLYEGEAQAHLAHLPQADQALTKYLQVHPDSYVGLEALATVQEQENKPVASLKNFTSEARLDTPTSADLNFVALDYVLLNDYPDAIHWLQKATQFDANNGEAWYDLGRCYYTQDHLSDAQKALERAKTLMPDNVRVLENLGLTLDAEDHPAEAEREFRKAVELARKNPTSDEWPYLNYGSFLFVRLRAAEAIPLLKSAVTANPKCTDCHTMLGRALAKTGNVTEAERELEQAIALEPNDAQAHYQLGRIYRQAGDEARAKEQFAISAKLYSSKVQSERTRSQQF